MLNVISQVNRVSYVTPATGSSYAITALTKKTSIDYFKYVQHARAAT